MVKYVSIDEELEIPKGIVCTIDEHKLISVKGTLGEMTKDFGHAKKLILKLMETKYFCTQIFLEKTQLL